MKGASLMELKPTETAVIGDQIFTDIMGGRKAKMFTILVEPIDRKELFIVWMKRFPEKFVLAAYHKYKKNQTRIKM